MVLADVEYEAEDVKKAQDGGRVARVKMRKADMAD